MNPKLHSQKRILLLGDSRWRDAFGLALLKRRLIQRNWLAEVTSFDIAYSAVEYFRPDVLVLNHVVGKRNRQLATMVKRGGGTVVVMSTEGRPNTEKLRRWHDENTDKSLVDYYFAWGTGDRQLDFLRDVETRVVGCPRFDIYREEYSYLLPSKEAMCARFGLDPDREIIGIATSFPQAKFHFHSQQFHQTDSKDLGIYTKDEATHIPKNEWTNMQSLRQQLQSLILNYPRYQYVIKPHPMEDVRLWESWCREWGASLFTGYIWDFLSMVDLHIARSPCLTALEADMMQVPCYTYGNGVNEQHDLFDKLWEWEVGDFSYTPNEERALYLETYGFSNVVESAGRVADEITSIGSMASRNSGGVQTPRKGEPFLFTQQERRIPNLVDFQRVLSEHDHIYPVQDQIGHYGKSVTKHVIDEFFSRLT